MEIYETKFYELEENMPHTIENMPHTIYYIKDSRARYLHGREWIKNTNSSRNKFYSKHAAAKTLSELIRENLVDTMVTHGTGGATFISGLWHAMNSNKYLTPSIELHAIAPAIDIDLLNLLSSSRGERDTVLKGLKGTSMMYFTGADPKNTGVAKFFKKVYNLIASATGLPSIPERIPGIQIRVLQNN